MNCDQIIYIPSVQSVRHKCIYVYIDKYYEYTL